MKESSSPGCRVGFCALLRRFVLILAFAGTFLAVEGGLVGNGLGFTSYAWCVVPFCIKPGEMETAYHPDCIVRPGSRRSKIETFLPITVFPYVLQTVRHDTLIENNSTPYCVAERLHHYLNSLNVRVNGAHVDDAQTTMHAVGNDDAASPSCRQPSWSCLDTLRNHAYGCNERLMRWFCTLPPCQHAFRVHGSTDHRAQTARQIQDRVYPCLRCAVCSRFDLRRANDV